MRDLEPIPPVIDPRDCTPCPTAACLWIRGKDRVCSMESLVGGSLHFLSFFFVVAVMQTHLNITKWRLKMVCILNIALLVLLNTQST